MNNCSCSSWRCAIVTGKLSFADNPKITKCSSSKSLAVWPFIIYCLVNVDESSPRRVTSLY